MSNTFPKVFMKEVFDVVAVNGQVDYLQKAKNVLERSLLDYYAGFSQNKVYILSVDPVTSAQMARYNYQLLQDKVYRTLPEWLEKFCCNNAQVETLQHDVEKKMERFAFYHELLEQTKWYHFCVRAKISESINQLECEEISLQKFVCLILYLYTSRYHVSSDWHELLRH